MSLLRSILASQGTLKCKYSVINMVTMFIYMKETVQFREDIKKSLKKLPHKFHLNLEKALEKLLVKLPEQSAISMQVLLNLFLIQKPINSTLWK